MDDVDSWLASMSAEYVMMLSYEQYTAAYGRLVASGELGRIASGPEGFDIGSVKVLEEPDFRAVQDAIMELGRAGSDLRGAELSDNFTAVKGLSGMLGEGRFGQWQGHGAAAAASWTTGRFIRIYDGFYGSWGSPGQAFALAHEWGHVVRRSPLESQATIFACRITGPRRVNIGVIRCP